MRTDQTPVETRPTTRPKLTAKRPLDPTAAIAAHALSLTSVLWQAPLLRKSLFFAPVLRDSSGLRLDAAQEGRSVKNLAEVHPGRVAGVRP
jgi:hypothetical protein